jgi:hypothetical protein
VDELKNDIQSAVIWATGVPVPVGGLLAEAVPVTGIAVPLPDGTDPVAGVVVDEELPRLRLEQAAEVSVMAMTPAIARPFAG